MDLYQVLESDPDDSLAVIKERYQRLLLKHHPDKNGSGWEEASASSSEHFHRIIAAWKILGTPSSRQQYDAEQRQQEDDAMIWKRVQLREMSKDEEDSCWREECRCGGDFVLDQEELDELLLSEAETDVLVNCDTCSLCIQIQLVEDHHHHRQKTSPT